MKKIILTSLLLILSLAACSKADTNTTKGTKETAKVEEKKVEEKKDEKASEDSKMMDDFIKNGIVKKEEVLTVKDYPMGFFDFTSDSDQAIKFTYKEAKEELALDLKANEKTPVFFDEKLESVKIVSPNPGFKNATIKVEKHTKIESGDITKGLYKVSFTDEIKPGKVAFQSEDKNAIVVKLSKYGNVEPLSFAPHEKTSLRTEDVTLMAGDKILVDKAAVKVVDTVQENIDALDKDKEK